LPSSIGPSEPSERSRSVHVVSHHLDGFLRHRFAGLLHPAADPRVRNVSRAALAGRPVPVAREPFEEHARLQPYRITAVCCLPAIAALPSRASAVSSSRSQGAPAPRGSVARRRVPISESRSWLAMLWRAFAHLHVAMATRRHRRSDSPPADPVLVASTPVSSESSPARRPHPTQRRVTRTSRARGRSANAHHRPHVWQATASFSGPSGVSRAAGFKALLHRRAGESHDHREAIT